VTLLDDGCGRGDDPLAARSTQLSVLADRRGCGTAHVGTPTRGRSHACSTHQRATTQTKMSQSTTSVLRAYLYEPQGEKWVRIVGGIFMITRTALS
jgi:hypothetical protein